MQWYYYVIIVVIVMIITLIVLSFLEAKKASIKLKSQEFKNNMRKGQLIDVRTKQEYDAGHINGARNINVRMLSREYQKLRHDQPVYLYCASGKRSSQAAIFLKSKGFKEIYELENGLKTWGGQLK